MLDPLHPMWTHLPAVGLPAAAVLAALARRGDRVHLANAAAWCLYVGAVGAVLATATGIFDHLPYENTPLIGLIEQHQKPAFLTTALALTAAGWCAWGRRKGEDPIGSVPHLALLVAVGMLVVYTGLEGGELVYEHAIGVKDR